MLAELKTASLAGEVIIAVAGVSLFAITDESTLSYFARTGVLGVLCAVFIAQQWAREQRIALEATKRELQLREDIKSTQDELREVRDRMLEVIERHSQQSERLADVLAQNCVILDGFAKGHPCAMRTLAPEEFAQVVSRAAGRG